LRLTCAAELFLEPASIWERHLVFVAAPEFPRTRHAAIPQLYSLDLLARHPRRHRIADPTNGHIEDCSRECSSGPGAPHLRGSTLALNWSEMHYYSSESISGYEAYPRVFIGRLGGRLKPLTPLFTPRPASVVGVLPDRSLVLYRRLIGADAGPALLRLAPGRPPTLLMHLPSARDAASAGASDHVYWVETHSSIDANGFTQYESELFRTPWNGGTVAFTRARAGTYRRDPGGRGRGSQAP
jgi:hypothetical protein